MENWCNEQKSVFRRCLWCQRGSFKLAYVWVTMAKNTPLTFCFLRGSDTLPGFLTVDVSRRNNSVGQVLPYVPGCPWGDDCDSGSVQNGSPLRHCGLEKKGPLGIWNQMPRQFVIPSHLGHRQSSELRLTETHVCGDVVAGIAEELTPLFLKQAGWPPDVLPNVVVNLLLPQHLWVRLNPHVLLIFRNRSRSPMTLQPRTLCWRLVCTFKSTFYRLVAQFSLSLR